MAYFHRNGHRMALTNRGSAHYLRTFKTLLIETPGPPHSATSLRRISNGLCCSIRSRARFIAFPIGLALCSALRFPNDNRVNTVVLLSLVSSTVLAVSVY